MMISKPDEVTLFLEYLKGLTTVQREIAFDIIMSEYCVWCGREYRGDRCHCWDDE